MQLMIPTIQEEFKTNLDQNAFSIDEERSGLIISLLRNNIYSNTLLAAFKEVFSNALDEHNKYDIKRPVDIYLPNLFSPNITIRDYAKGISKSFMMNEYTKVGLSTKSHTNDVLGGLGIGRMSPLAYTDLYTVTSITIDDDGDTYKREYVVSKDNNKVFCSLLLEEKTEDETGVSVSFEIKKEDYTTIKDYVTTNTRYLTNVNIDEVPVKELEYIESFKSFKTIAKDQTYGRGHLIGLIGGLPNIIKLDDLMYVLKDNVYSYILSRCNNVNVLFDIPIGSIDQSADKNIQLSTRTKNTLASILTTIYKDYKELVTLKVKSFKAFDEVLLFLYENNLSDDNIMWNGINTNTRLWLKDIITFTKSYKGNYKAKSRTLSYGSHYNKFEEYYYNDLDYIPSTKELVQSNIPFDIKSLVIVNNIDNSYYNLRVLSSHLPKTKVVKTVKPRAVSTKKLDNKCYRLSVKVGEIGRELNVDLNEMFYYISFDFYNLYIEHNFDIKQALFKYINKDIYVVRSPKLVEGIWIDLLQEIKDDVSVLNDNYFDYFDKFNYQKINRINNKQSFINKNPDHIVSKFLVEAEIFDKYTNKNYRLIQYLYNKGEIKLNKSSVDMAALVSKFDNTYPFLSKEMNINLYGQNINDYITLVDFYNKHNKNI